jgi:hypothetical protein
MKPPIVTVGLLAILIVAAAVPAQADTIRFRTGVDSMNYAITTWTIRTGFSGKPWAGKTPTYFMFDTTWYDRYTNTGPAYTQSTTGTAVVTDVFSQADLQAVATSGSGFATMTGGSSPISFWEHGGQFLKQSGGNDSDWADDTYWASNEYGCVGETASTVVTEYTASFQWDGLGANRVEGKILADDRAEVYINSVLIYTTDSCAYDAVETFSYDNVLLSGANALKVIVYDPGQGSPTGGPTALQLDLVPEPTTMLAVGAGLVALIARMRRRARY